MPQLRRCHLLFLLGVLLLAFQCDVQSATCGCDQKYKIKRDIHHPRNIGAIQKIFQGLKFDGEKHINEHGHICTSPEQCFTATTYHNLFEAPLSSFEGFRAFRTDIPIWPDRKVYYAIMSDGLLPNASFIRSALNGIEAATNRCVTFYDVTPAKSNIPIKVPNYVTVTNVGGCMSMIGFVGGAQKMTLGDNCLWKGTVQHEFMHALGIFHEHMRPDRDDYVKVFWDKVDSNYCGDLQKCKTCKTVTTYNVKSIMHYASDAFACNENDPNMMMKIVQSKPMETIEYNDILQPSDVANIMALYGCDKQAATTTKTTPKPGAPTTTTSKPGAPPPVLTKPPWVEPVTTTATTTTTTEAPDARETGEVSCDYYDYLD